MARCAMTGRAATAHSATASITSPRRFIPIPPGEMGVLGFLRTSKLAPLLEIGSWKSRVGGCGTPRSNAHNIRCHLKKAPHHSEPGHGTARPANLDYPLPQEGHEGGVAGQNPQQPVKCGRHDGVRLPVENRAFRGDDRDVHQAEAIFLACATTSSMPPCM